MAQRQFRSDDTDKWLDKFGAGTDGAFAPSTGTDAPVDSACTGTSGTTSLSATNASFAAGQIILIHQSRGTGAGSWELNKIASYAAGTITTSYSLTNTYGTGAQVLVVKQYSGINIAGGVTYTAKAYNLTVGGIVALMSNGNATIAGSIVGTGTTFAGGNGAGLANQIGYRGNGNNNTLNTQSKLPDAQAGGGGNLGTGGTPAGGGHGGGNGAQGGNGVNSDAGNGGAAVGNASLVSMHFGGGGGGGGAYAQTGGAGGNGGGIVIIISKTITVSGSITNQGTQGGAANSSSANGGGGGGAGGSVLLKGQIITLGSSLVVAAGGGGGAGDPSYHSDGGVGSVGRIHADYSTSISGTTNPTIDSTNDSTLADPSGGGAVFFFL